MHKPKGRDYFSKKTFDILPSALGNKACICPSNLITYFTPTIVPFLGGNSLSCLFVLKFIKILIYKINQKIILIYMYHVREKVVNKKVCFFLKFLVELH